MAQIFKIKYEDTTRRMCVPRSLPGGFCGGFCYSDLEKSVRDFFEVPCTSRVIITYVDIEGDVVTIGNDQDLVDACVTQRLNPLKLEVKVVPTQPLQAEGVATIRESMMQPLNTTEFDVGGLLKGLFPASTAKAIEQVLSRYPPSLFTTVPAHALPEALDTFLKTLIGYTENSDTPTPARRGHPEAVPKQAVHKSVCCDHCEMFPIVGPRYKSTKKEDYDLCSKCYLWIGNPVDYIKLDRPKASEVYSIHSLLPVKPDKVISWPGIVEKNGVKDDKGSKRLDAQFVADVTFLDGTKIEIGTSFTKVWRLKNSGMLPWPPCTQLVHIGGNLFGSSGIVKLKLPKDGLPCGSELDVSVVLKAPTTSARHDGHWRLMSPSGQMFGDEVWVSIEAVPDLLACEATVEHADDFFLNAMLQSVEVTRKEALIGGAALEHASDSAAVFRYEDDPDEEIASNSCLKETLVNSPVGMKEPLVYFPTLATSHDCFPLAADEECAEDETFISTEGFELVDSELVSEDSNDGNTEPLQRSRFEEDDFLSWDCMSKELEALGLYNTQTNKDLLLKNEDIGMCV